MGDQDDPRDLRRLVIAQMTDPSGGDIKEAYRALDALTARLYRAEETVTRRDREREQLADWLATYDIPDHAYEDPVNALLRRLDDYLRELRSSRDELAMDLASVAALLAKHMEKES